MQRNVSDPSEQHTTAQRAPSAPAPDAGGVAALSVVARLFAVALGLFSLLGMLWIGQITPGIAADLLGLVAACIPASKPDGPATRSVVLMSLAILAFVLQIVDVAWYYAYLNISGNYYPWVSTLMAFAVYTLLAFVGWRSWQR